MRRRRPERAAQYRSAAFRDLQGRLAANVRALREARGWTQEEAAHRVKMAPQLLQRIEAGTVNLTFATLARLSHGFTEDVLRLLAPGAQPVRRPRGRPRARPKTPSPDPPETP